MLMPFQVADWRRRGRCSQMTSNPNHNKYPGGRQPGWNRACCVFERRSKQRIMWWWWWAEVWESYPHLSKLVVAGTTSRW